MILANPKSQSLTWENKLNSRVQFQFYRRRYRSFERKVSIPEDNPDQKREVHSPVSDHNERRSYCEGTLMPLGSRGSKRIMVLNCNDFLWPSNYLINKELCYPFRKPPSWFFAIENHFKHIPSHLFHDHKYSFGSFKHFFKGNHTLVPNTL